MTDHSEFQDDLKAYADGELSWPRRFAVRRHLTHCASCREELQEMTQITEDLRAPAPNEALDPALRAKLLGIASEAPGTGSARLGKARSPSGAEEKPADAVPESRRDFPPSNSPARPVPGAWKRPILAWTFATAAIVVWLLCFPMFQHVRENARSVNAHPQSEFKQSEDAGPSASMAPIAPFPVASIPSGAGGSYPGGMKFDNTNAPGGVATPHSAVPVGDDLALRQVHKEASIGVQVANPEAASDKVETLVKEAGGFVLGNTLNSVNDGLKSAQMTVKVPVPQFESVLAQIAKLGSVQSKNVTGEDITEKTSDADQAENILETDVTNSEARLKALGAKAKWSDQQATRDLRTQLAQARARLVLLRRMAALSTITVDLSQTPKPPAPTPVTGGFLNGLKGSTHDALQSLLSSAGMLLALVIWLLAYAPIWIPLLLVGRYALREYRKRQAV